MVGQINERRVITRDLLLAMCDWRPKFLRLSGYPTSITLNMPAKLSLTSVKRSNRAGFYFMQKIPF